MNRRSFLAASALAASAAALLGVPSSRVHIATNVYPWITFARRRGNNWNDDLRAGLKAVASTGVNGFEPIGNSAEQIRALGPLLNENDLEMRSLYVNSNLHEPADVEKSIADVLAIANEAKKLGTQIVVTNPSPIRWGGDENKSDQQLITQAKALDELGSEMNRIGLTLAYHNHDAELRMGGREFHHMLTATDPDKLRLCLDSHWIFRGCGDSQVALFDAVQHYHERIVELHLRQSLDGVWNEVFTMAGDIDYRRVVDRLAAWDLKPHLVLEQAVEAESPDTMTAAEAHAQSRRILGAAVAS